LRADAAATHIQRLNSMLDIISYDWIAAHAQSQPEKLALIDDFSSRQFSYRDLDRRVGALAAYMQHSLDVRAGDRVATLAHNSTNIFEVQFACMRIGAIFVPLNVRLALPELQDLVTDCGAKVIFHDNEFAASAAAIRVPAGAATVEMHELGSPCAYEDGIRSFTPVGAGWRNKLDDCWTLIYTSGTTGRPKGVMISYQMVLFHAINYAFATGLTQDSHGLTFLPMFHTSGLNLAANPCFVAGASVTVMRRFDPARALKLMAKASHVFGVPANYLFMRQLDEFTGADLSGIHSMGVGGAPMPIPLLQAYADKGVAMQQTFGMTETGPTVTILTADRGFDKLGSAGLPVVHVETCITDEHGAPVPHGEIGELRVRGPSITCGYWNQPEESVKAFHQGWFRTGDMARQDEDGYFYIVDRCKNMYISGGENVYPAEVERVIEKMPGVLEVCVIGEADDKWGEVGHAFVAVDGTQAVCTDAIIGFCRQEIAGYKVPKYVSFVERLPRNATGKVDRKIIKQGQ
jgi:fatty-acyl-CoA synthase